MKKERQIITGVCLAAALTFSFIMSFSIYADAVTSAPGPDTYLCDMEPFGPDLFVTADDDYYSEDNYGTVHKHTLVLESEEAVEYNLGGAWNSLSGSLFVSKKAVQTMDSEDDSWGKAMICVYGDGHKLYEHAGFTYKDKPLDFEVDVSGVELLKIECYENSYYDIGLANPIIIMGDPLLSGTPASAPNTAADTISLTTLEPFGSQDDYTANQMFDDKDVYGNVYTFTLGPRETPAVVEYNLAQQYSKLGGVLYVSDTALRDLGREDGSYSNAGIIIYADDEKVFDFYGFSYDMKPQPFEIDLTGVEFLRIECNDCVYVDIGMYSSLVVIGNPMLYK